MLASAQNNPAYPRRLVTVALKTAFASCAPVLDPSFFRGFIMLKRFFVTLLTMLTLVGAAATITGCNTVEGAGKDVQQAGGAIRGEANEHR